MKTPEEINCGMECIRSNASRICIKPENGQCPRCEQLVSESLGRIQQLESRLAQVERGRDAAVRDMRMAFRKCNVCCTCKYEEGESNDCMDCIGTCNWEWRGVCAQNTEEGSK